MFAYMSMEERKRRVEEHRHKGRRAPQLLVLPLLILPSCVGFFLLLPVLWSSLDSQPSTPLTNIAQEREWCARGQGRRWCCAHRGARTLAPENTMAAFLISLKVGANCIEMDVHRTSDGEIAVIHASHFRNKILPANGHLDDAADIRVEDTPWGKLQSLDAGGWFSKQFEYEHIPTFTRVLETFWDVDVRLIVELKAEKCPPSSYAVQCQHQSKWEELYVQSLEVALIRVRKEQDTGPRFSLLFTSFNHSLVNQVADMLKSVSHSDPAINFISGLGYILDPHLNYTSADFHEQVTWLAPHVSKVAELQHLWRGSRCVSSWVTDSSLTMGDQYRLGVQAVTTNVPSLCPTMKLDR